MNGVQKLMHVLNLLSVQPSKGSCVVRILTNGTISSRVATVTGSQATATTRDDVAGYLT
jgi:hypothetical protein